MSSPAHDPMPRCDRATRVATSITGRWRRVPFPAGSAFPRRELRRGVASIPAAYEDVA
jgi:hypothetical protein